MKLDRKEILKALESISVAGEGKNMVESGAVTNVLTFGDEVVIELVLSTPAMHIRKRAEDDIRKMISEKFSADAKVKVNTKVETPDKNEIKGKSIPDDAEEFYSNILVWFDDYVANPCDNTVLKIDLEYFNISSSKRLLFLLYKLNELKAKNKTVRVQHKVLSICPRLHILYLLRFDYDVQVFLPSIRQTA